MSAPLPKPARVEKWQRWRDSRGVMFTAIGHTGQGDKWKLRRDGECGEWFGSDMLARTGWTFLGYAKPDKVEVGQRWRNQWKDYVVEAVSGDVANMGGISRASIQAMLTADTFEYLGMAESAPIDGSEAEAAVVNAERITRAIAKALPEPDGAESDRLHAAIHENDKRVPTTKRFDSFGRPMPGTRSVVGPPVRDPKTEARRANEEAAKRLIANPPDWAYPRAWMCAVLAMVEMGGRGLDAMTPDMQCYDTLQTYHHRRAVQGMTHAQATVRVMGDALQVVEAYARGMERPFPLLTRQGVRGISTVDIGEYYE